MATLQEIRAKLLAQENKSKGAGQGDNSLFPFWNIDEGSTAILRFLPDADPSNSFFWQERNLIKLPFAGIKGDPNSKPCIVQVPCMEMWPGETCPILAEVRPWFKDKSLEEMGRKYWKKRNYLFQGFVRKNPMTEENTPESPIRRFVITPSVFNLIKAALMDPELEDLPVDFTNGLDFHITKTTKGGFADYGTSKWSRKTSALTDDELAAVEKFGLADLKSWLPKKPTEVELKVMVEMFEASVDGQAYDPEKWGQYFKPFGLKDAAAKENELPPQTTNATAAPAAPAATVTEPVVEDADDAPAATVSAPKSSAKAEDILALIRSRQKAPAP